MSVPLKHHYAPVFYLKRWARANGQVLEYRLFQGRLAHKWKFASATGFERELYAVRSRSDPQARQEVERRFMSRVDHHAAQALDMMERTGAPPGDGEPELRNGWARFLMSLLHRSPQRIARLREAVVENSRETMEKVRLRYDELRGPDDPASSEEYLARHDAGAMGDEVLAELLPTIIDSQRIGDALVRMQWGYARLDGAKHSLLTCDSPLSMSNGLGHRDSFVVLPVAPDAFFVAGRPEVVRSFTTQGTDALVRGLNDAVVGQARHMVVAADEFQDRFVLNRFGRVPEPGGRLGVQTRKAPLVEFHLGAQADVVPPWRRRPRG